MNVKGRGLLAASALLLALFTRLPRAAILGNSDAGSRINCARSVSGNPLEMILGADPTLHLVAVHGYASSCMPETPLTPARIGLLLQEA